MAPMELTLELAEKVLAFVLDEDGDATLCALAQGTVIAVRA